jgi:sugar phosphate isomerase/epimerase
MRRISISELSSLRWSFHQDVIRYASHGFDSIGIWRQKVDDFDIFETADFLFEMRMNVSSVHWAGGFTGGDGRSHREAIHDAADAIQTTSRLNADCLIVHPGCRNGHTLNHANRLFKSALQELMPVAHDYGVKLTIEPMPCCTADAWNFLDSFESSLDLISDIASENLGLALDLYHVGLNPDVFEDMHQFAECVSLVQVADRTTEICGDEQRLPLGQGDVPLGKWLERLQSLNYSGMFEIELHGAGMQGQPYNEMLDDVADFFRQDSVAVTLDDTSSAEYPSLQSTSKRSSNK